MNDELQEETPEWRPLTSYQRRVAGVLVEKAKTTPDAYPLTVNAITNACNQKSNRSPQMQIASDDVELTLDELREMGVVTEVQGGGRVAKYKHRLYDWLGVDKTEIAVMAELLLRGTQTVGELRGRAHRMEPIPDLGTLQPLLAGLEERNLVVFLTPPGRGQVVTHGLFRSEELKRQRKEHADSGGSEPRTERQAPVAAAAPTPNELEELKAQVRELEERVARLEQR